MNSEILNICTNFAYLSVFWSLLNLLNLYILYINKGVRFT